MLIYGKEVRESIKTEIREATAKYPMILAVLQVGEDPASSTYVKGIVKFGSEVGVQVRLMKLGEDAAENLVLEKMKELNQDPAVTGIMVLTPLPKQLNQETIVQEMDPDKDAEGVHPINLGKIVNRKPTVQPSTPKAVMRILKANGIDVKGKRVTIVGRSTIVGTPLALMMMDQDATITLCHTRTRDLAQETLRADIVVAAAGKIDLITAEMICEDTILIDVGTNFDQNGKMHGDVSAGARRKARIASAVPGGVGTITVAELFDNLRLLKESKNK